MDDKLYLVTCEGFVDGYGTEIFLIGIFTTEEQAISERDKVISQMKAKFEELNGGNHVGDDKRTRDWYSKICSNYGESGYYDDEIKHCGERFRITPVRKNEVCSLKWEKYTGFVNDYYLGGYVE